MAVKGGGLCVYNATVAINDSSFEVTMLIRDQPSMLTRPINLVIGGTNLTGNTATSYGSMSLESDSNFTVANSIFDNNRGANGAAIGAVGCVYVHIIDSSFTRNVATLIISRTDYGAGGVLDAD